MEGKNLALTPLKRHMHISDDGNDSDEIPDDLVCNESQDDPVTEIRSAAIIKKSQVKLLFFPLLSIS